jgi:hypothetical protein
MLDMIEHMRRQYHEQGHWKEYGLRGPLDLQPFAIATACEEQREQAKHQVALDMHIAETCVGPGFQTPSWYEERVRRVSTHLTPVEAPRSGDMKMCASRREPRPSLPERLSGSLPQLELLAAVLTLLVDLRPVQGDRKVALDLFDLPAQWAVAVLVLGDVQNALLLAL